MKEGDPGFTLAGTRLLTVAGLAALIVNVTALLVPPPGVPVNTVTFTLPAVARFVAGTIADNDVELMKVVAKLPPFQRTIEPLIKFVPVTVMVVCGAPTVTFDGVMLLMVGTG